MSAVINNTNMETHRVRNDGEWATIAIQGWQHGDQHAGELLIHSSFGSWGYQWTNIGQPMRHFLVGVSFDYLMGKLTGERREFDFDASIEGWKKTIVAARRARKLSSEQLRVVWDDTAYMPSCGLELFVHQLSTAQPRGLRNDEIWDDLAHYVVCRRPVAQERFWQTLWLPFVDRLQGRLTAANDGARTQAA